MPDLIGGIVHDSRLATKCGQLDLVADCVNFAPYILDNNSAIERPAVSNAFVPFRFERFVKKILHTQFEELHGNHPNIHMVMCTELHPSWHPILQPQCISLWHDFVASRRVAQTRMAATRSTPLPIPSQKDFAIMDRQIYTYSSSCIGNYSLYVLLQGRLR